MFWSVFVLWVLIARAEPQGTTTTTTTLMINPTNTISTTEVTTAKNQPVRVINELTSLAHGIHSGKILIIGNNNIQIPNFHFDGKAPTAYFIVGKGEISENGTRVPLSQGSTSPLTTYEGQNINLTLPDGLSVDNLDWLAVWCFKYRQNLGYVFLKKELSPYPPQTFSLNNIVTSGPIVLVDKKTLFIPNFRYDGTHKNVRFWVGNGSEPSPEGVPVLDEKGSSESLSPYQGQNLNINLPGDLSTDKIEYFGVWSIDEQVSLGHVPIKGIEGVPEAPILRQPKILVEGSTFTMRLPKCCSINSVLTANGCQEKSSAQPFKPTFKVYDHNETHFSNESLDLDTIDFQPFISTPVCQSGKYPLDKESEEFAILRNSSLLVKGAILSGVLSLDNFCLEHIEGDNETLIMKILVCFPEFKIQKAMFVTYVTFTIISTFCFAITFFLYFFWLKIEDVHRKCFTGYVFSMTITFLSLTIIQTADVENSGCEVLGFFFQFFMIASFTLLGILCFDIWIIVKYIDEDMLRTKRKRWYLGVALFVPILFLIISLSRNLTPDVPNSFFKPQYLKNACYFEAESQRTIYFYVPICLSIVVSAVFLLLTKLQIVKNDRDSCNNYFWIEKGTLYKFMFRQCLLTLVIMTISWISNVLMSFLDESSGIFNAAIIFEALQGVLIVAVFSANHFGSNYLERRKSRQTSTTNVEMNPLNQNNHTSE